MFKLFWYKVFEINQFPDGFRLNLSSSKLSLKASFLMLVYKHSRGHLGRVEYDVSREEKCTSSELCSKSLLLMLAGLFLWAFSFFIVSNNLMELRHSWGQSALNSVLSSSGGSKLLQLILSKISSCCDSKQMCPLLLKINENCPLSVLYWELCETTVLFHKQFLNGTP